MRKCPKCNHEMSEDCYLLDKGQPISDFVVVEKDNNLKKTQYPIKVILCKTCGYIELYAELDKED